MEEIWKPLYHPNVGDSLGDRYLVSNKGRVKSLPYWKHGRNVNGTFFFLTKEKFCSLNTSADGYSVLHVSKKHCGEKKKYIFSVHRLVAFAFVDKYPEDGFQVNHINGVKKDNRPENLEWVSCRENVIHSYKTGLASNAGDRHPCAMFTNDCIRRMRYLVNLGICGSKDLAKAFGAHLSTVQKIINRRHYGSVL